MKDWVITDAAIPGLYLGALAWLRSSAGALRFPAQEAANAWLDEMRRTNSPLVRNRSLKTVEVASNEEAEGYIHTPGTAQSDWNPFGLDL
ncbi:MAG: hypothetical protein JWL84_121 [Rhodospirillales bacterium]|nr:hypothetical protein [Rhodospirillales bacterium]